MGTYIDAAFQLLPPGRAFTQRVASNLGRLLQGLTDEFERIQTDANELRDATIPSTAWGAGLDAWHSALGLAPGSSAAAASTALRGRAGHNLAACVAVVESFGGYGVDLWRATPLDVNGFVAGVACYDEVWRFQLCVYYYGTAPALDVEVQAALGRLARAHTYWLVQPGGAFLCADLPVQL